MVGLILLAALISAGFVRFAPGFGIDERELDTRLNIESIQAIRESHKDQQTLLQYYAKELSDLAHGDLGKSRSFERPISELVQQRWGASLQSLLYGLPVTWAVVFSLAATMTLLRHAAADVLVSVLAGGLLAIPAATIALFSASLGHRAGFALALVLAPTLFRYTRNILERSFRKPHVLSSRAKGIGELRVFFWHVLPTAIPQIVGLVGVSVSMAIGALIPIEFLCDSPGLGQLALQSALSRDLPLLVCLTGVVTMVTLLANMTSDIFSELLAPRSA